MTIDEKDKARLIFKYISIFLVILVLIGGIILASLGKAEGFIGIAGPICTFAGAVFGIDYFSVPKDNKRKGE